ncbi:MAG: hypothetical protein KF852_07750 [Saprospiraceae bacterium]|nr:hypothetical protein [Saprospiraceae bacterium]
MSKIIHTAFGSGVLRLLPAVLLCCALLPGAAQSIALADSLFQAGHFRESVSTYEQFIAQNPRRSYDQSVAWLGISQNYLRLSDYEQALAANDRSKAIRDQLRADDLSENFMRYGAIYLQLGQFEEALGNLQQAKAMPSVEPYQFALMEGLMADAYKGIKNYVEAERHYLLALESLLAEDGDNHHPTVVAAQYKLGRFYLSLGRLTDAKDEFLIALRAEQQSRENSTQAALLLNAIGEVTWGQSGHEAARSFFIRALIALESGSERPRRETALTRLHLGRSTLEGSELIAAALHIQKALQALYPGFQNDEITANPDPEQPAIDRVLAAQTHALKARYFASSGTNKAKLDALNHYTTAIALLEEEAMLSGNGRAAEKLNKEVASIAAEAVAAAMNTGDPAAARLAYEWAERSKMTLLRTRFALPPLPEHPLAADEKRLRLNLREAQLEFVSAPEDAGKAKSLIEQRTAFFAFCEQVRAQAPHYYVTRLARQEASVAATQSLLDDKTALLSYFSGGEQLYLFALSRTDFKAHTIPLAGTGLQENLNRYASAFEQQYAADYLSNAAPLYTQLIEPVKSALSGKNRLIVIPHHESAFIPFDALLTTAFKGAPKKVQYAKLPYLAKKYAVQYHLAAPFWSVPAQSNEPEYVGWTSSAGGRAPSPAQSFFQSGRSALLYAPPSTGGQPCSRLLQDFKRRFAAGAPAATAFRAAQLELIKDKTAATPFHWAGIFFIGQ